MKKVIKNPIHKGCGGDVLYVVSVVQFHSINKMTKNGDIELNSVVHCNDESSGEFVCDKCDSDLSYDEIEEKKK